MAKLKPKVTIETAGSYGREVTVPMMLLLATGPAAGQLQRKGRSCLAFRMHTVPVKVKEKQLVP